MVQVQRGRAASQRLRAGAGESLGHSELIRQVHNSFAAPHAFLSEEARAAREEDDLFHFIAYLPRAGRLWELDGLTRGPIDHGACTEVRPGQRADSLLVIVAGVPLWQTGCNPVEALLPIRWLR